MPQRAPRFTDEWQPGPYLACIASMHPGTGQRTLAGARTICVVDDDALLLRSVSRLLRAAGYDVSSFLSADELLAFDGLSAARCIVLDIHIGKSNGFDVNERLIACGIRIPVVFISGSDEPLMSDDEPGSGQAQYVRKPFDADTLLGAIERALAMAADDA